MKAATAGLTTVLSRWTPSGLATGLMVVAVLAAIQFAFAVWRATFPIEIDRNEAWNAWHVLSLLRGQPLYPPPDALVANNYPPLSFHITAAVARFGIDPIVAGRAMSLVACLAAAGAVVRLAHLLGADRAAAAFGAVWFVATLGVGFGAYLGMNDPSLLALALMAWALVWLVGRRQRGLAVEPAILAMVAAGFVKHNLVAIPAAALIWLWLQDRRAAMRAGLTGIAGAVIGLALCRLAYGSEFLAQLLFPREIVARRAYVMLAVLQWLAPAAIFVLVWLRTVKRDAAALLIVCLMVVALAAGWLQRLGAGVDVNAYFELLFAVAVGLAVALARIGEIPPVARLTGAQGRWLVGALMLARLVASFKTGPYLAIASPAFRAEVARNAQVMTREAARVAAIPGAVQCSVMTVCYRAGKPFVFDDFAIGQRVRKGRLSAEQLDRQLGAQSIRFETVDERTEWQGIR